jgi:hypothetical protein
MRSRCVVVESDYESLYEQFVQKKLPCRYEAVAVRRYFIKKYGAISLDPDLFVELKEDPFFIASNDTHVYAIVQADATVNHSNQQSRWVAVDEGKVIYVVFQSKDGLIDRDFFSVHGHADRVDLLEDKMAMFNGIDPDRAKLDNPDFQRYLKVLQRCGMLT